MTPHAIYRRGISIVRRVYFSNVAARALLRPFVEAKRRHANRRDERLYALVRRLGDTIVEDVVMRADDFCGSFRISPKSDLFKRMIVEGRYEPDAAARLRAYLTQGGDFVDIGANVGFFSILAAKHMEQGRVLAVEPNPSAYERLTDNIARNEVSRKVTTFAGLVSDFEGTESLNTIVGMEEYSSIGSIVHQSAERFEQHALEVKAIKLDRLVEEGGFRPALLKVDVEGAEMRVLTGARETLKRHRPVVMCEMSRALLEPMGSSPEEIASFFAGLDYVVRDVQDPALGPGLQPYGDAICVPVEKAQTLP
ncbi:MAG: FkbM family methyltransferase [Croceibacterium sp.]